MTEDRGPQTRWAGIAIAAIWAAVLAVGLWGDSIYANSGSVVPTVVVVAPCALIATIVIARRAFTPPR